LIRDGADRKFVPAVRTASAASVRCPHRVRNPEVLPRNSNGDLHPLTQNAVLLITFFSGCEICQ